MSRRASEYEKQRREREMQLRDVLDRHGKELEKQAQQEEQEKLEQQIRIARAKRAKLGWWRRFFIGN